MWKPKPRTPIPDEGSNDRFEMDQCVKPNPEFISMDNMNVSVSQDSLSQITAETELDMDMDDTQSESTCVSNVSHITA